MTFYSFNFGKRVW